MKQTKRILYLCALLLTISTINANADYCNPFNGFPLASNGSSNMIKGVFIHLGNLDVQNAVTPSGYASYYYPSSQPKLRWGSTYGILVKSDTAMREVRGWVDFDADEVFESPETIAFYRVNDTVWAGTVKIPTTATYGSTRLRLNGAQSPYLPNGPCGDMFKGESEEYHVFIDAPSPCNAPTNLKISEIAHNYAKMKWVNTSQPYNDVEYFYSTSNREPVWEILHSPTDSAELTGLKSGTKYYVYARTVCGGTDFSPWIRDSFTTPACNAPTVAFDTITDRSVVITFTNANGATHTEFVFDSSATPPSGAGIPMSVPFVHFTALTPGKQYCLHTRSVCWGTDTSAWVTKCFTTTTVSVDNLQKAINAYYPNPVKDVLHISLEEEAMITLIDISGRELSHTQSSGKQAVVNMSNLAEGIYFIRCKGPTGSETIRVLKSNSGQR